MPANISSHLVQRMLGLPPPVTRDLVIERDLRVPMADGAVLLADRRAPRGGGGARPAALLRTPYGRRGAFGMAMARPLAERGFQVLIQSTRGTFGSGGAFDPMRCERDDGLATLQWLVKQPWFGGTIVLCGPSYLGYVQWAVADDLPPEVKAMIPQVTESALTLEFLRPDGFSLETPFGWEVMVAGQERRWARPIPPPSGATPATSRTSWPMTRTRRAGPGSTTGTGWPGSACRSARSAAGTTSSCPASCATSRSCRRRGGPPG